MQNLVNLLLFSSFMGRIGGILLAVVVLLAMITVHEFGHYIVGRVLGFKINEFSIGFGPAIFKKRSKKTGRLFAIRIVPLGGYCAFDGEDEFEDEEEKKQAEEPPFPECENTTYSVGDVAAKTEQEEISEETLSQKEEILSKQEEYPEPEGKRFNEQAPWKRILVLIAGATMNYLLALVLIIVMFSCFGRPMYSVIKEKPELEPTATQTETTYLEAESDGLQTGDIILKINGKNVYLITDYMKHLDGKKAGDVVTITVLTGGKEVDRKVVLQKDANFKNMSDTNTLLYAIDVYGLSYAPLEEGFFQTIGHSFAYSFKLGGTILRSLGELLTGKLGIETMGGPVTTIKVTAEVAMSGVASFLNIAALIGVNLAVFNLLPIPALDGCKVIFCLIEWIRKKPVNRKVEAMIHFVGIIFLFGFAILVDLLQLF